MPVGRMSVAQMRGLAAIAARTRRRRSAAHGLAESPDLRRRRPKISRRQPQRIEALGLAIDANAIRAGLVACTGNAGCKFAASDTKRHAEEIARWCETRVPARHAGQYPSDRLSPFLRAAFHRRRSACSPARCRSNEDDDPVEGYHILVGGGFGPDAALGRELYRDVVAEEAPRTVERILKAYLAHRASPEETFLAFSRRHEIDALKALADARRANERDAAAADSVADPGVRAVLGGAAHLAQRSFSPACSDSTENVTPVSAADAAKLLARLARRRRAGARRRCDDADDGAPWHDPAMPLADRMKLAEGRPLPRRLMAAMAQQDCGQCGYNCQDYADALFAKSEERLNLCVPGGKETSRMLKQLHAELGAHHCGRAPAPAQRQSRAGAAAPRPAAPATIRSTPRFSRAAALNKPGSEKETWHIDIDLAGTGSRLCRRRFASAFFRPTIRDLVAAVLGDARCAGGLSDRRSHASRSADRRRLAVAGARHAVRADLLPDRRRTPAEGEAARGRRGSRMAMPRRSTCSRRCTNFPASGPIPEAFIEALDPLQPRRLFDLVLAQIAIPAGSR